MHRLVFLHFKVAASAEWVPLIIWVSAEALLLMTSIADSEVLVDSSSSLLLLLSVAEVV